MVLGRKTVFALALLVVTGLALTQAGEARKNGVSGRAVGGCTCHGNAVPWEGLAGQLPLVLSLEGVPEDYEPGELYELEISVAGGLPYLKAGFNLNASAGTLSVGEEESNVQITTKETFGGVPGEATHKTPDSRAWSVAWTAPREGSGPVAFLLAVNSVNGNDQPDAADQWNLKQVSSMEKNLVPRPPVVVAIRDAGLGAIAVNWTASPDQDIVRHELYAGPQGFKPHADFLRLTVENASAEELQVSGLEPGTQYEFVLRAIDKGKLVADSPAVPALVAPVSVPSNLTEEPPSPSSSKGLPAPAASLVVMALLLALAGRRRGVL